MGICLSGGRFGRIHCEKGVVVNLRSSAAKILVIDDDEIACEFLQEALSSEGYRVKYFTSARRALEEESLSSYDLLISDIKMPGMDGIAFLREVKKNWPEMPVILVTAFGTLETTMEALRIGAWDYISKPFSPDAIRKLVKKVLDMRQLHAHQKEKRGEKSDTPQFIGSSAVMVEFYKQIARVADSDVSILIEGESGTGKELAARSLHLLSERRDRPFIPVHCGAIPETLLESELFGYEKGAFTGADKSHTGLLEAAQGGTIFLDEITEMSPNLQGKLLRFMQNGEIRRLGDTKPRQVTVRVVAAANKNVDEEVKKGSFRADLLYRFVVRLHIPPLREHKEDLPLLIESLLKKMGYAHIRVSDEAMEMLMAYDWPGNVRELQNVLKQSILLSPFGIIQPENLPDRIRRKQQDALPLPPLEMAEREQILNCLNATQWNISRAAQLLDIDRKTLKSKMVKYGLVRDTFSGS
ncbi:MAG: sigma-54 dependent transcriptional regulator [Syntrophales bacterium]|nr:sigma-54 dependent transcriptional regulator [Syntrophales bacterium]